MMMNTEIYHWTLQFPSAPSRGVTVVPEAGRPLTRTSDDPSLHTEVSTLKIAPDFCASSVCVVW